MSSSCDAADFYNAPIEFRDETIISLDEPINTIQDGYVFAYNRVMEWAKLAKLFKTVVYFTEEQIESRRGLIEYQFTADNGIDNYLARATVTVDMKANTSILFDTGFDPRTRGKRTKGGVRNDWDYIVEVRMTEWTVTLDEAFDIVYREIGEDAFKRFENPKITLVCSNSHWIFYVTKENENWHEVNVKHLISIDPITKEVLEVKGFEINIL